MSRRIFWLCNHTSLRKTQVPMLIDLGFEVFCPKRCSYGIGDNSTSISFDFDVSLTIPEEVLREMNDVDYYEGFDSRSLQLMNEYFDIVMVSIPLIKYLEPLLDQFHGAIVLLAFGLDKSQTYTNALVSNGGFAILEKIRKTLPRFWFAPSYEGLADIEAPVLRNHSVYLPLGLKDAEFQNKWKGGDNRFLFISPKIKTHPYYKKIYTDFKENFGDIPHVIGGSQLQPVEDDPSVCGFLSDEEYEYNMTHLCAMFYHSQEPRHLHYHPLEAVKLGMPLVFMSGGMLDYLGGKNLPGRCKSIKEARKKIVRLSKGDKRLIKDLQESQIVLLDKFKREYVEPYWVTGMKKIVASLPESRDAYTKPKKIGFVLPAPYTGGVLDYSIRFILSLKKGLQEAGDDTEIFFSHPIDKVFEKRDYFKKLKEADIPIRTFRCEEWDYNQTVNSLKIAGLLSGEENKLVIESNYSVLRDDIADFNECDQLVLLADVFPSEYPVLSFVPYTVVVHDYIQRYVPSIGNAPYRLDLQKKAKNVLVMSRPAFEDAIQYGELSTEKVHLMPMMLEVDYPEDNEPISESQQERNYFIWTTNAMPHKNHIKALEALSSYYMNGGSMKCIVTGANTKYLKPGTDLDKAPVYKEYVAEVQETINKDKYLLDNIEIKGELQKSVYRETLRNAAFLFHPGYADNGNMSMVEAAGYGVPTLSSDYPASRYMAEYAGIEAIFMDAFDSNDILKHIIDMEKNHIAYAKKIPGKEILKKSNYLEKSEEVYSVFCEIIGKQREEKK